jgi:hypothetical protein
VAGEKLKHRVGHTEKTVRDFKSRRMPMRRSYG